jgi:hypothetical protein
MPRFFVAAFDPHDNTHFHYITRIDNPSDAICNHPWITEIYKNTWVAKAIWNDDVEVTIANCHTQMGWSILCVNLDEEIMKDLNGGGSSVSLATQQS